MKASPPPVVRGPPFGRSSSQANYGLPHLLPVPRAARGERGVAPAGAAPGGPGVGIGAGTGRRRQRPQNAAKQARHDSGKKKTPTGRSVVPPAAAAGRARFLRAAYPGAPPAKRVADAGRRR